VSGLSVAACLFTDIEGSSALVRRLGARYEGVLERHHEIIRAAVARQSGVEQSREGDSLFITFASASAAVEAAVAGQQHIEREQWPPDGRVRVRMGLHVGEVAESRAGLVGLAIHQAARIMTAAHGGQIVVSGDVVQQASRLPDDITMRPLGEYDLRDVGRVHLFQVEHPDLQADFPELRINRGVAHHLPVPLTSLVGRVAEAQAVGALLHEHRLVTLVGVGGCGKTRLALRVAEECLGRFVDGVWFVDLAVLSPGADVTSHVAQVLGLRGGLGQVTSALEPRNALLVLDNCEHVAESAAALVTGVLTRCPATKVMATSRAPLEVSGEARFYVPPLEVPHPGAIRDAANPTDAVQLFTARARLVRPGFQLGGGDAQAVGELCTRLDGLPLAIELAAARLGGMSLAELVSRFDDRFGVLVGGPRTVPERHQTLRKTMEWTFQLLDAEEQQVLRHLAVFRGGCDIESAEAVCGTDLRPRSEVLGVLIRLVDKSLVTAVEVNTATRYSLHETIREYALQSCGEDERNAIHGRHAQWFATLASGLAKGPAPGGDRLWIGRHEVERENFRAAADWLVTNDTRAALRLLLDIEPGMDLTPQSRWCYELIARVLPKALSSPAADRAHALAEIAIGCHGPSDPRALPLCAEALGLLHDFTDPVAECAVRAVAARCHAEAAGAEIDHAQVAAAVAAGDRAGGTYWPIMVRCFLSYGSPPAIAESLSVEALRLAERSGLNDFAALFQRDLATIAQFCGNATEALATYRRLGPALDPDNACFYALAEGEHGELAVGLHLAEHLLLELSSHPHDPTHAAALHTVVAHLHRLAGDLERCQVVLDIVDRIGEPVGQFIGGLWIITHAALLRLRGHCLAAAEVIERACARVASHRITDIGMRVVEELAAIALSLGRRQDAADLLATAREARHRSHKPLSPALQTELNGISAKLGDLHGTPLEASHVSALAHSMAQAPSR
jgi:predicted ATPase/class 3 adenylate cyclase